MTKTFFVDGSHWLPVHDWPEFFAHTAAVIWKATEGTGWVDSTFALAKERCVSYGKPWGAYHFFLPGLPADEQARHFVRTVGDGCCVYVADIETATLKAAGVERGLGSFTGRDEKSVSAFLNEQKSVDALTLAEKVKLFLDTVELESGLVPLVYTSPGFWNYNLRPTPSWSSNYELWVAHYTSAPAPMIPNGWTNYRMWQYSETGRVPGTSGNVDCNWYNGDEDDLMSFFANGSMQPPFAYERAVITADRGVRVRATPSTLAYFYFVLPKNTVVEVLETINLPNGDVWVRVGQRQYCAMVYKGERLIRML